MSNHPKLHVPRSGLEKALEVLGLGLLAVGLGVFALNYPTLPDIAPTHFGMSGKADDYGNKAVLLIFPVLDVILYGGLSVLSRFPHRFNYPVTITPANAPVQYRLGRLLLTIIKVELAGLIAGLSWLIIDAIKNGTGSISIVFMLLMAALIVTTVAGFFLLAFRNR